MSEKKPKRTIRTAGPPDPDFAARATLRLFLAFLDGRARAPSNPKPRQQHEESSQLPP